MMMQSHIKRFCSDERGNFAIMGAGLMTLVVGCAALGVDLGSIFADRRKTQSTADLAAIVAASNLTNATNAATATLTNNNYPASALKSVQLGTYTANSAVAPSARFVTPATGTANAARVTLNTQTPLYFAKFFTGSSQYTIKASATATTTQMASFEIGSGLVSINAGLLNSLLGSLLGTTLSLSVMDYQSLASAKIDAFSFLSALATRVNLTAGTYSSILSTNLKVGDIIAAALSAQQVANGASTATTALSSVSQALNGVTTQMQLGSLIDVGPYGGLTAATKPQMGVAVSVLDLLNATAQIANGTHQIATNLNLTLPGIASVVLMVTIGERAQGSSWLVVGTQGASVHTAQTRALLQIKVLGTGAVSAIDLPVYVEVAAGTATLNSVSCGYPNISTSTVALGVTPGIVNAWIGNVTAADMTNFTTSPNPPAATLVNLGLITVSGRANAYMGNTTPTNVNFSYADIQALNKKTVTTSNFTSSLTGSLLGNLSLTITIGPLGLPIAGLGALVSGILGGVTGAVDQLLAGVLQTLGIGIGTADVWVNGIRCDGAVLVN
jgi:uncharacterized membrane protein